jgi:molybdenum cofactor synthesis domain-containing protein
MITTDVIVTGNELLTGLVTDTNTSWLCKQLTGLGAEVRRAVLVRDDGAAISREIREAFRRQVRVVFLVGGLGPTDDDRTLSALALALEVPAELHPQALAFVTERYTALAQQHAVTDAVLTPAREKMALLPQGTHPIANPVGVAPAVTFVGTPATVIALPGVPAELKGFFAGPLAPLLHTLYGNSVFLERDLIVDCTDESQMAPLLQQIAAVFPHVYVKSHARRFGADVRLLVTMALAGPDPTAVEETLKQVSQQLMQALTDTGISSTLLVSANG